MSGQHTDVKAARHDIHSELFSARQGGAATSPLVPRNGRPLPSDDMPRVLL